jgi:hypothetical protein
MVAFCDTKPHEIALSELKKNPVQITAYQIIFAKDS